MEALTLERNRISSKREKTNGINQVQQTFTSEQQMLRLGSGSKSEGSTESLLQCSEVLRKSTSFWKERHTKHKSQFITKRDMGIR